MKRFNSRFIVIGLILLSGAAQAAVQISVYSGLNTAFDSDVTYSNNGAEVTNNAHWDGQSFQEPPYYGVRGIYWFENAPLNNWGLAIDYTHDKVVADPKPPGYTTLEFTDGLNLITTDLFYHFLNKSRFTPYAGLGVGLSIPHVEVTTVAPLFPSHTFEYQISGIALAGLVGVDVRIWQALSLFGEYKLNYSQDNPDLNQEQSLKTQLWVNNYILGMSYLI